MSALQQLAKMFRVRVDDIDAVMRSERGYRAAISRRSLFAAGAALAAGSVFVGGPLPILLRVYSDGREWYVGETLAQANDARADWIDLGYEVDDLHLVHVPDHSIISIWTDPKTGLITSPDKDGTLLMLSAADWARRNGAGFLCTTEY